MLGARDLVLPAMVDAAVEVMGAAYPEIVASRDTVSKVVEREEQAFRATLQRGVEMLDELARRGATCRAPTRSSSTTRSGSRSTSRARSRRTRGRDVDVADFDAADGRNSASGRAPRPTRRAPRVRDTASLARGARRGRRDRVHRPPGAGHQGDGGRARGRPASGSTGSAKAARSRWCSTARRSTRSRAVRSATPARSRSGRRRRAARRARHAVRHRRARWSCTSAWCGDGTLHEGDEVEAAIDARAPRPDPPQPHRDAHPALGAARGARHPRAAGRIDGRARSAAVRLQPPRRGHARAARARSSAWPTSR